MWPFKEKHECDDFWAVLASDVAGRPERWSLHRGWMVLSDVRTEQVRGVFAFDPEDYALSDSDFVPCCEHTLAIMDDAMRQWNKWRISDAAVVQCDDIAILAARLAGTHDEPAKKGSD